MRTVLIVAAFALVLSPLAHAADEVGAASPAELLATARSRGTGGFYAARDASARRALITASTDVERLEALVLLADTAHRTDDWTAIDLPIWLPEAPPPGVDGELAWQVARVFARGLNRRAARAWVTAVPQGSSRWWEAAWLRFDIEHPFREYAKRIVGLESMVQHGAEGVAAAQPMQARARFELARYRCGAHRYDDGLALLDSVPGIGATDPDWAATRAWCAVVAARPDELAALLPELDTAARAGAWLPSLPLLRALAAGADADPATQRGALAAVEADYHAYWRSLDSEAAALAAAADAPLGWKHVFTLPKTIPGNVRAAWRASPELRGLERRREELAREEKHTRDPEVRADIETERAATSRRAVLAATARLDAAAREVGALAEQTGVLIRALDPPPPRPAAAVIAERGEQRIAHLRALLGSSRTDGPTRAEMMFRLSELEAGSVPPAARIDRLQAAFAEPAYERHEEVGWALALLLVDAGRPAEAEGVVAQLARASPPSRIEWKASVLLGDLAFARQDFAAAGQAYTTAEAAPDRALRLYATYRKAWCAWALGRPREASALLAVVLSDPSTPPALRESAQAEQARLGGCRKGVRCTR